jgi:hypothetical protein
MKYVPVIALLTMMGCTSAQEKQANNEAQIKMIAVQREAQKEEREAAAEAQKELYRSLLGVAQADPSQSGAVAMALAFQGMKGVNDEQSTPIVALQQQQNEALQWAQALAPIAGGVISTVGTAIISGNVQKRQIEATRDVQINQANQTANAIGAVASLGTSAAANAGDSYGGDYYSLTDSSIDNSTTSTTTQTAITDSYNTTDNSDNSIVDNGVTNNDYSTVTYEGQEFSLPNLLAYLQGTGLAYSLNIGDTVYTVDGDGDPTEINCNEPQFSPAPPECTGV